MQLTAFRRRVSNRYISHAVTATPPTSCPLYFSHAGTHTWHSFRFDCENFTNFQSCKLFFRAFFKQPFLFFFFRLYQLQLTLLWFLFCSFLTACQRQLNYFLIISLAGRGTPNQTKQKKTEKNNKKGKRKSLPQTCWHKYIWQQLLQVFELEFNYET